MLPSSVRIWPLAIAILIGMLFILGLALWSQSPAESLDALVQKRDAEGLRRLASPDLLRTNPDAFLFVTQNGVYETGRFGWRALALKDSFSGRNFVVFSTPLTSEDIGEQVFEASSGQLTRYVSELDKLGIEPKHHDLQVRFDLEAKKVSIVDKMTFNVVQGAGKSFLVRMSPHYKVQSVKDTSGKAVAFAQAGGVVVLPVPANKPKSFGYTFNYSAVVDRPNFAGSISSREATLTNDYWYPMIARWPSTFKVRIVTPPGWTAISQGEGGAAGDRVFQYDMRLPVTYFSLTAGPFKSLERKIGNRNHIIWSTDLNADEMRWQTELNAPILDYFEKSFGKYPFSQWGSLISPSYGGGALEAYSYATYGLGWLPDEDAHEPAHTWWGGVINNTYLKSLWNESFASFCDDLYRREGPIGQVAEKRLAFVTDALPEPAYNAATCVDSGAHIGYPASSLGYGKGAKVLQMLEQEIGTEKLLACMREWIHTHPKGVPGEWEHFEAVMYRVVGPHLKKFFDQWLRRTGWADFEIEGVQSTPSGITGRVVWKSQPYDILCDVLVEYNGNRRVYEKVRLTSAGTFSIPDPMFRDAAWPVFISFDPWRRLLRRHAADETPVQLDRFVGRRQPRYYLDPARKDWLEGVRGSASRALPELPADLNGVLVIGHPETTPRMKELCQKVGFEVQGNLLRYRGTTLDLTKGTALAVVELGEGKRCVIGLGKSSLEPRFGRSRLCLADDLGRFLRGETEPKTSGFLTHRFER